MEVPDKKRKYCKPCERRQASTYSDGFCSQCEEEMCQRCFDTHKQFKLNRGHRLDLSVGATSNTALREETVKANRATPVTKDQCSQTDQSLMDRQLVCKNLIIDGDLISYDEKAKGDLGLFIDKNTVGIFDSFEIEVMSIGTDGDIAVGVVPDNYPNNLLPGLGDDSYGYHSDGKVFKASKSGQNVGNKWTVGDRIRVEINSFSGLYDEVRGVYLKKVSFSFTHIGEQVHSEWMIDGAFHFAVGIGGPGGEIRVT